MCLHLMEPHCILSPLVQIVKNRYSAQQKVVRCQLTQIKNDNLSCAAWNNDWGSKNSFLQFALFLT